MKKVIKKYDKGGPTNKQKVEANRKKVEANREKVLLGKKSPNSSTYDSKPGSAGSTYTSTNEKGNVDYKSKTKESSKKGELITESKYTAFSKPRRTESSYSDTKPYRKTVKSAQSMDTTGYAAGKKTFVLNSKTKSPGDGDMYTQTSKKVSRKDVPKTLAKMQKMKKGGMAKMKMK